MRRSRLVGAAATVLLLPVLQVLPASNAGAGQSAAGVGSDVRELTRKDFSLDGGPVKTPARYQPSAQRRLQAAGETPPVGTVRQWLGLDDFNGRLYRKDYTLRGAGNKIEVWVANDTAFPAGDCRAQVPNTTTVTDAQVNDLVNQFDTNMFPKETAAFSTPPDRDGSNAILGPDANGNGGVYTGGGDKTVTLVDNVRDDNFYNFPAAPTYIAGFFSTQFNELFDRNVMTIDAFDWAHRTGTDAPNDATPDLCTSRPARPRLYEGVFAHEWQHLLHSYTDPFEGNLLNEGLSDFAQTLTGYVDARLSVFERGFDNHINCFLGFGSVQTEFNSPPRDCGGPENSLNLWNEGETGSKVLADYGNAYAFLLYLFDRYGTAFMSQLHRDGQLQGLASLKAALAAQGADLYKTLHDFQSTVLLDKIVGDSQRGIVLGVPKNRVTTPSLRATVNFGNGDANNDPGAAPNGADFVALQGANGTVLNGRDLRSLSFQGAKTLPSLPLEWTVDPNNGNPVLFSGNANSTDAAAVTSITVPAASPTLTFLAKYGAEFGFDYGYVGISTDGGATYTHIRGDKTVDGPLGPGLNGTTNGFEPHTFDLAAYAGKTVLLSIRYVSDGGVNEGGLLVDDIKVGGTLVSDGSSLDIFKSPTQIKPTDVHNWNVKLIGLDEKHQFALQAEFNGKNSIALNRFGLLVFTLFPKVVAVVAYDEPTEQVQQYAPYTLTVNGVVQPGGGGS